MDLSETIIAAMIGAGATMATAIFQLVRNRAPIEVRPKKNRVRSLFATVALMAGCIVGGYAWASLRAVSATEQMRATLQTEFSRQFSALAAHPPEDVPAAPVPYEGALAASHTTQDAETPPCQPAETIDDTNSVHETLPQTTPTEPVAAPITASLQ